MYSISDELKNIILAPTRNINIRIIDLNNNKIYDNEDIVSFSLISSICDNDIVSIGSAVSDCLNIELLNNENSPATWKTINFRLEVGFAANEEEEATYNWIPLGVFYPDVTTVKKDTLSTSFTAYDAMYKYGSKQYKTNLNWVGSTTGFSFKTIVNDIITNYGITFTGLSNITDFTVSKPLAALGSYDETSKAYNEQGTLQAALQELALLVGANCKVDRNGNFEFKRFTNTNFSFDGENYISFNLNDSKSVVSKIQVTTTTGENEKNIEVGDNSGATYSFTCNSITSKRELEAVYNRANLPYEYWGYDIELQGFPHLDTGDIISFTEEVSQVSYPLYVVTHTLDFNGMLTSQIKCQATEEQVVSLGGSGMLSGTIAQSILDMTNVKTILANSIEANTGKFNELDATVANINTMVAAKADITELNATNAEVENLQANKADIDLGNINNGCITTAMIGTGAINTAQIADGSITDAKIVGLTANKITAGTLDAGEIDVINLNAENITVGTINGNQIANGTISLDNLTSSLQKLIGETGDGTKVYFQASAPTGSKSGDLWYDTDDGNSLHQYNGTQWVKYQYGSNALSANSITAGHLTSGSVTTGAIAAGTIEASNIASGAITTDKVATGAITANELSSNSVTSDKIVSNAITADKIATATITANEIAGNTITAAEIASGAITTTKLAANAVTAGKLDTDAITSTNYNYSSGSFSTTGSKLDLATGTFRTPYFMSSGTGSKFKGSLEVVDGTIGGWNISNSSLWSGKEILDRANITSSTPDLVSLSKDGLYLNSKGEGYISIEPWDQGIYLQSKDGNNFYSKLEWGYLELGSSGNNAAGISIFKTNSSGSTATPMIELEKKSGITLANTLHIMGKDSDGIIQNLIGTSSGGDIVVGESTSSRDVHIYSGSNISLHSSGNLNLGTTANPIQGKIYHNGNEIGERKTATTSTAKSVSSASWTDGTSIAVTEGTWVFTGRCQFAAATAKRRGCRFVINNSGTNEIVDTSTVLVGGSTTSQAIYVVTTAVLKLMGDRTIKIQGYQDTGSALNMTGSSIDAVRIC